MPGLILSADTIQARLESERIEVIRHGDSGKPNDFSRLKVPLYDIDRVVVCGRADLTTPVLHAFMRRGIPVYYLTSHGRWLGALSPDNNMNAGRRICQYRKSEDAALALKVASEIVFAKIRNSRRVLQRLAANRSLSDAPEQKKTCDSLELFAGKALSAASLDVLRGYEGMAAAVYFARLGAFFPEEIPFSERSRRPPRDAANAILSWTYSIVLGEVEAAVRSHGLDPCIGFLHAVSDGTPSLALDLLEALRGPLCDLLALHLLNHKVLKPDSFEFHADDGGTYLKEDARKEFFFSYENSMTRLFTLKKDEAHTDFRKIIQDQVMTVVRILEGEEEFSFFLMP